MAAVLAVLPLMLSGCDLLLAGLHPMDPFSDPFSDPFADPGTSTEFDRGQATLVITQEDGQTVVLDQVFGSTIFGLGTTATWRNDDGWSMTIGYAPSGNRCIVDLTNVSSA